MGTKTSAPAREDRKAHNAAAKLPKCEPPNHSLPREAQYMCERESCREKICDNCCFKEEILDLT